MKKIIILEEKVTNCPGCDVEQKRGSSTRKYQKEQINQEECIKAKCLYCGYIYYEKTASWLKEKKKIKDMEAYRESWKQERSNNYKLDTEINELRRRAYNAEEKYINFRLTVIYCSVLIAVVIPLIVFGIYLIN